MNSTQRKFLIERIQEKTKKKIEDLRNSKLKYPSASNYLFRNILNGQLELQPKEVIMNAIMQKALKAQEGENWLSEQRLGYGKEREIRLLIEQLIQINEQ